MHDKAMKGVTESGGQLISLKANLIPAWGKE